jgi:hypothetical protein
MKMHGFYMTKHAVSNLWWDVFAADTGRSSANRYTRQKISEEHSTRLSSVSTDYVPVKIIGTILGLRDVQEFIAWVSKRTGQNWRLPAEAEIESVRLGHARSDKRGSPAFSVVFSGNERGDGYIYMGGYDYTQIVMVPDASGGENEGGISYLLVEPVRDCWHVALSNAPVDGEAWTDACDHPDPTFLGYSTSNDGDNTNTVEISRLPSSAVLDRATGDSSLMQFHLARDN